MSITSDILRGHTEAIILAHLQAGCLRNSSLENLGEHNSII